MSRHSEIRPKLSFGIASVSALSITEGAVVALTPMSSASVPCESDLANGVTGTLVEGGTICEIRFLPKDTDSNGSFDKNKWTFTAPEGVSKVSALLVGAGSSGTSDGSGSYSAAGGAGGVLYIDDIGTDGIRYLKAGIGEPVSGLIGGVDWKSDGENGVSTTEGYSTIGTSDGGR